MEKVILNFKTGNIVMADYFRTDNNNYQNYVENKILPYTNDINTFEGTVQETKDYANLNIGYVFVGNNTPKVLKKGNMIMCGNISSDELDELDKNMDYDKMDELYNILNNNLEKGINGWKLIDNIDTNLWWASIIDKSFLNKILFGKEELTIEEWNDIPFEDLTSYDIDINVEPGEYELYFPSEHYEDFSYDFYNQIDFEQINGFKPYFVLIKKNTI